MSHENLCYDLDLQVDTVDNGRLLIDKVQWVKLSYWGQAFEREYRGICPVLLACLSFTTVEYKTFSIRCFAPFLIISMKPQEQETVWKKEVYQTGSQNTFVLF